MSFEKQNREKFISIFLAKNEQLNLSAIRDADGVYHKHILDSLELMKIEKQYDEEYIKPGNAVVDIGTGGGIPLLPLAVTYPAATFTGVDSVRKKTEAVLDMAQQLGLTNVSLVWSRIEEYKGVFDVLTARAVAFSDKLFSRSYGLVKKGGLFILYKMFSEEEEAWLDSYIVQKKMTLVYKHYYILFEGDIQRVIYIIQK